MKTKESQLIPAWAAELQRATETARQVRNKKTGAAVAEFEKKRDLLWAPYAEVIERAREEFKQVKQAEFQRCRAARCR